MPVPVMIMLVTGLLLQGCFPTPNYGRWKQAWYYDDNSGSDMKTNKPRVDPKNNTR